MGNKKSGSHKLLSDYLHILSATPQIQWHSPAKFIQVRYFGLNADVSLSSYILKVTTNLDIFFLLKLILSSPISLITMLFEVLQHLYIFLL